MKTIKDYIENTFDAVAEKNRIVAWIKEFFAKNGPDCNAVIGISGGKDSSVVAALCVEALGRNKVLGVKMPCGEQTDIDAANKLIEHLGLHSIEINIKDAVTAVMDGVEENLEVVTDQTKINLPARIRMATLYAVSQSVSGRVMNTCNLSENYVGFSTRYGDCAGDASPLGSSTVAEVKAIGRVLGLPEELIEKTPSDGLTGKSDEDNLGFTYEELDSYITFGVAESGISAKSLAKITKLHNQNAFKLETMPEYRRGAWNKDVSRGVLC